MTANTNLERRVAEHYASEPQVRAPDRVLHAALATIDTTRQRRGIFAPWRFTRMRTFAKLAAATAVVAVIAFGVSQFVPGLGTSGPPVAPSPSPSTAPDPSVSPVPTVAAYVPPELTETFTSEIHGITISYPTGWTTQPATEPWTTDTFINFRETSGDFLYDTARNDHLFLELASQPLAGATFEAWSTAYLTALGVSACTETETVVVDGADGVISACRMALLSRGGRGYAIALYTSADDADLQAFDAANANAWFDTVLATVQLRPGAAVDTAPSASP